MSEHAVIAYMKLSDGGFGSEVEVARYFELEDNLEAVINDAGVGEFDGNEVGEGFFTLYMYGPDADKLAEVVLPVLERSGPPAGSYVLKRYGDAEDLTAREEKVLLKSSPSS